MMIKKKLLLIFLLIIPGYMYSQDSLIIVPDGTQGENFKFSKERNTDSISDGAWNQFDGPFSTLRIGGGFLYEYAAYIQDDISKEQIKLEPAFKLRDFRVTMSGKAKVKRLVTWKFGIMFDGPSNSWFLRETGILVGLPELSGHIFVGRTKEGFSLNKVMVGYAGWTLERQMALDVIPILADGVKILGFLPDEGLFWNVGVYTDWISYKQSFSTYKWQFAARFGWLPIYSEKNNTVFHIGVNYRYGEAENGKIRLKSRPEAFPAPFFIDTQEFPTHHSTHVGAEVYFSTGPLMLGSEFYMHQFSSPETGNPVFPGGDIVASYMVTGNRILTVQ